MKKSEWIDAFESIQGRKPTPQEFQEAMERQEFVDEVDTHCPKCKMDNPTGSPFCPNCGTKMDGTGKDAMESVAGFTASIADKINSFTGGDGQVELKMRDLFSQVFVHHTSKEADEIFACGSETTTPTPKNISKQWPKPWYFMRVFFLLLLVVFVLFLLLKTFQNELAITGILFTSAMLGPISILFFYFECNSPRNISIIKVLELFLIGGVLSILVTIILNQFLKGGSGDFGPALVTGIVEELSKLLVTAFFIKILSDKRYILNGLLIGGAIGAGFDVFESAGYNFQYFYANKFNIDIILDYLLYRGVLTGIGAHVAWAAITGAGLMMVVNKQEEFQWNTILLVESLKFFILVVLLHAIWYTSVGLNDYIKIGLLTLFAFIIILVILNRGLKEINDINKKSNLLELNKK